jgi:hypothetical protein
VARMWPARDFRVADFLCRLADADVVRDFRPA